MTGRAGPALLKVWLVICLTALIACQMAPTKISQTAKLDPQLLTRNAQADLVITEDMIVIDARSAFEYASAHIPGSISLTWDQFTERGGKFPGKLTSNLSGIARRLSLYGINPQSKVLVVGNGKSGQGEEGRVAWTLLVLGIPDVRTASIAQFRSGLTNAEPPPRANVESWKVERDGNIEAQREEVLRIATGVLREGERPTAHIIDVRTRKEYFDRRGFGEDYVTPDLRAVHIPWTDFFLSDGRPNLAIRDQLQSIGIDLNDRVITISRQGVRSGAVAFALLAMGYRRGANYSGGYIELITPKLKKPKIYQ